MEGHKYATLAMAAAAPSTRERQNEMQARTVCNQVLYIYIFGDKGNQHADHGSRCAVQLDGVSV